MIILSNPWWVWVWNTFSMSILGVPLFIGFILKLLALFNPNIPSNAIIDLFKDYWPTGAPGAQAKIDQRQDTVDKMQVKIDEAQVKVDSAPTSTGIPRF